MSLTQSFGSGLVTLCFIIAGVWLLDSDEAQGLIRTPTPFQASGSIFDEDTCSPPCWFGLVPGQSTSEQTIDVFRENEIFVTEQNDLQLLLEGERDYLPFSWHEWHRDLAILENHVYITQGVVSAIEVTLNEEVSLRDTLEILGQPDVIVTTSNMELTLGLVYPEQQAIVFVFADPSLCEVNTMYDDFIVFNMSYNAPDAFEARLQTLNGWGVVEPASWAAWENSVEEIPCARALIQQEELYFVATSTPTFSATSTATN